MSTQPLPKLKTKASQWYDICFIIVVAVVVVVHFPIAVRKIWMGERISLLHHKAGKDDVKWKVSRGRGKGAAHQISVDDYAKDPEEIAVDGAYN